MAVLKPARGFDFQPPDEPPVGPPQWPPLPSLPWSPGSALGLTPQVQTEALANLARIYRQATSKVREAVPWFPKFESLAGEVERAPARVGEALGAGLGRVGEGVGEYMATPIEMTYALTPEQSARAYQTGELPEGAVWTDEGPGWPTPRPRPRGEVLSLLAEHPLLNVVGLTPGGGAAIGARALRSPAARAAQVAFTETPGAPITGKKAVEAAGGWKPVELDVSRSPLPRTSADLADLVSGTGTGGLLSGRVAATQHVISIDPKSGKSTLWLINRDTGVERVLSEYGNVVDAVRNNIELRPSFATGTKLSGADKLELGKYADELEAKVGAMNKQVDEYEATARALNKKILTAIRAAGIRTEGTYGDFYGSFRWGPTEGRATFTADATRLVPKISDDLPELWRQADRITEATRAAVSATQLMKYVKAEVRGIVPNLVAERVPIRSIGAVGPRKPEVILNIASPRSAIFRKPGVPEEVDALLDLPPGGFYLADIWGGELVLRHVKTGDKNLFTSLTTSTYGRKTGREVMEDLLAAVNEPMRIRFSIRDSSGRPIGQYNRLAKANEAAAHYKKTGEVLESDTYTGGLPGGHIAFTEAPGKPIVAKKVIEAVTPPIKPPIKPPITAGGIPPVPEEGWKRVPFPEEVEAARPALPRSSEPLEDLVAGKTGGGLLRGGIGPAPSYAISKDPKSGKFLLWELNRTLHTEKVVSEYDNIVDAIMLNLDQYPMIARGTRLSESDTLALNKVTNDTVLRFKKLRSAVDVANKRYRSASNALAEFQRAKPHTWTFLPRSLEEAGTTRELSPELANLFDAKALANREAIAATDRVHPVYNAMEVLRIVNKRAFTGGQPLIVKAAYPGQELPGGRAAEVVFNIASPVSALFRQPSIMKVIDSLLDLPPGGFSVVHMPSKKGQVLKSVLRHTETGDKDLFSNRDIVVSLTSSEAREIMEDLLNSLRDPMRIRFSVMSGGKPIGQYNRLAKANAAAEQYKKTGEVLESDTYAGGLPGVSTPLFTEAPGAPITAKKVIEAVTPRASELRTAERNLSGTAEEFYNVYNSVESAPLGIDGFIFPNGRVVGYPRAEHVNMVFDAGYTLPGKDIAKDAISFEESLAPFMARGYIRMGESGLGGEIFYQSFDLSSATVELIEKRIAKLSARKPPNTPIVVGDVLTGEGYRFTIGDFVDSGSKLRRTFLTAQKQTGTGLSSEAISKWKLKPPVEGPAEGGASLFTEAPGAPIIAKKAVEAIPRPPTITAIERQARGPSVEQRAALPRAIDKAFFVPGDFTTSTNKLISQIQRAKESLVSGGGISGGATTWDNLVSATQRAPILRQLTHFLDPASAAFSRAVKEGKVGLVPLAAVRRSLWDTTQGAAARVSVMDWVGRNRSLLGIDGSGFARSITAKPDKLASIPKGAYQRLDDIMEHPMDYAFKPGQSAAMEEVRHTYSAMLQKQLEAGIDIAEARSGYWRRIVTRTPRGLEPITSMKGHTKLRSFKTIREGIDAGYEYANPLEALQERLVSGIETIGSQHFWKGIQALGEKPSARLAATPQPAIRAAARESYKQARATYDKSVTEVSTLSKKTRTPDTDLILDELEARVVENKRVMVDAQHALARSARGLRLAARKAAQPHVGEALMSGRIFPQEVVDAVRSYQITDPGITEDFFRAYRGTMVTGDLSQLMVQGINLLYRHPVSWFKASAYSIASLFKTPESYIVNNIDTLMDGIRAGAVSAPEEWLLYRGGTIPKFLGKLPGVRHSQRAFEWFALVGQNEMWKAYKGIEHSGLAKTELASAVRKLTGVVLRPGLTSRERQAEALLAFAPRFTIAMTTLLTDAFRAGIRGQISRRAVGSVLAGATASTIGLHYLINGKFPNYDDPEKKDWASVSVPGGGTVSLYGPYHPYMRSAALMAKAVYKGDVDMALEAASFLARGRASATIGPFVDLIMGETVMGKPVERGPIGLLRAYLERAGPIGPRQVIENIRKAIEGEHEFFPAVFGEIVGLRTSPYTSFQRLMMYLDSISPSGKWDDLSPSQQWELRQEHPEIAEQEWEREIRQSITAMQFPTEDELKAGREVHNQLPPDIQRQMGILGIEFGAVNRKLFTRGDFTFTMSMDNMKLYQGLLAKHTSDYLTQLTSERGWEKLPDMRKAEHMKQVIELARESARNEMVEQLEGGVPVPARAPARAPARTPSPIPPTFVAPPAQFAPPAAPTFAPPTQFTPPTDTSDLINRFRQSAGGTGAGASAGR